MRSFEQQYAEKVLGCMHEVEANIKQEYGGLCHKFPYMVLTNGLRLTVAFFQAKGTAAHKKFLDDLVKVLGLASLESMTTRNSADYRVLTLRALKAAAWFKRYAQAVLKVSNAENRAVEPE